MFSRPAERTITAILFTREGWPCQPVLLGSQVLPEIVRGEQRLSRSLEPGESPIDCALELISQPRCLMPAA